MQRNTWISMGCRIGGPCLALMVLWTSAPAQVVLASHHDPIPYERELLSGKDPARWSVAREKGYVVEEIEGVVFVRPNSLYNLQAMEALIEGMARMSLLATEGARVRKIGDLPPEAAEAVRTAIANSLIGRDLGAFGGADDALFVLEPRVRLALSDGGKTVTLSLPEQPGTYPDAFFRPLPSPEDRKPVEAPKLLPLPDRLDFHFSTGFALDKRARAVQQFAERIAEAVEGQDERYRQAQATLGASMVDASKLPEVGSAASRVGGLAESHLGSGDANARALGFANRDEFRDFLQRARVSAVTVRVRLGVGVLDKNGNRTLVYGNLWFDRKP